MNYINITYPDINNGLGIRATIWFAGCPFHCKGCHNKETWDYSIGHNFDPEYVFNEVLLIFKENPYLSGITLSGGDPLGGRTYSDLEKIKTFLKMFKEEFPDKTVWLYSGAYYKDMICDDSKITDIKYNILHLCDYIVDGPFEIDKRDITLPFRGSSNQRILKSYNGTFLNTSDDEFKN